MGSHMLHLSLTERTSHGVSPVYARIHLIARIPVLLSHFISGSMTHRQRVWIISWPPSGVATPSNNRSLLCLLKVRACKMGFCTYGLFERAYSLSVTPPNPQLNARAHVNVGDGCFRRVAGISLAPYDEARAVQSHLPVTPTEHYYNVITRCCCFPACDALS